MAMMYVSREMGGMLQLGDERSVDDAASEACVGEEEERWSEGRLPAKRFENRKRRVRHA